MGVLGLRIHGTVNVHVCWLPFSTPSTSGHVWFPVLAACAGSTFICIFANAQALLGDPETNAVPPVLSSAVMLAAVAIEATADLQLDRFIASSGSGGSSTGVCIQGLWGELSTLLRLNPTRFQTRMEVTQ